MTTYPSSFFNSTPMSGLWEQYRQAAEMSGAANRQVAPGPGGDAVQAGPAPKPNTLGIFTAKGARYKATLMETAADYGYFTSVTGQAPDEDDMFLLDAQLGRHIDFLGAVFLEEIHRNGKATGQWEVILSAEFNARFSQNLPIR